jgi:hypothetical protein
MERSLKTEYEMIHKEVVEVRTCITDYIKMFFGVGIAVVGLFSYIAFRPMALEGKLGTITLPDAASGLLNQHDWGFAIISLAYITLTFASILFHKFNTHNRGAGYLRALEQERHQFSGLFRDYPVDEIRLWQSGLATPFQKKSYHWGCINSEHNFRQLEMLVAKLDSKYAHPFSNPILTTKRCTGGLMMILRSTIYRAKTRSWTYPFQVAFGPLMVTILLFLTWLSIALSLDPDIRVIAQVVLFVHILTCWFGLGYRMHRLCASAGDRTIEAWCWRSMIQRHAVLAAEDIDARYVGWARKSFSDAIASSPTTTRARPTPLHVINRSSPQGM